MVLPINVMDSGRDVEVLIHSAIMELKLKEFPIAVIGDGAKGSGFHGGDFHGWDLNLDNCGLRLRLRSPKAAAISFRFLIVASSPTAGAMASITR